MQCSPYYILYEIFSSIFCNREYFQENDLLQKRYEDWWSLPKPAMFCRQYRAVLLGNSLGNQQELEISSKKMGIGQNNEFIKNQSYDSREWALQIMRQIIDNVNEDTSIQNKSRQGKLNCWDNSKDTPDMGCSRKSRIHPTEFWPPMNLLIVFNICILQVMATYGMEIISLTIVGQQT